MLKGKYILCVSFALLITVTFLSCKADKKLEKPIIAVSILPQAYFLGRIAGETVKPLVLVGEGQNPHSWEPTPRQMSDLSKAAAWVLSGTDFEITLKPKVEAQFSALKIVDGTEGVRFRLMEVHEHDEDEHAEEEDHEDEGNIDRHTWLGRENAKIMTNHIVNLLVGLLPANEALYRANAGALISEIDAVYDSLAADLAPLSGTNVFVYHPSFGYFFDEFGITQISVETGGKEPTAKNLAEMIEHAREEGVKVLFVQQQFPVSAAKTVADATGSRVVALDPLSADWMGNIKQMGEELKAAIRP